MPSAMGASVELPNTNIRPLSPMQIPSCFRFGRRRISEYALWGLSMGLSIGLSVGLSDGCLSGQGIVRVLDPSYFRGWVLQGSDYPAAPQFDC